MAPQHTTEQYFQRIRDNGYTADASGAIGNTPYRITRIGFGGYRITDDSRDHAAALQRALLYGCNVIDTSSNYTDGGSERLIGKVLSDMQKLDLLSRDEIVIVSKAGYVQGNNMQIARERQAIGQAFPEIVEYSDTCWHCIHPEFLDEQIQRSLQRLMIEYIDFYLLHNPEYFLLDCKKRGDHNLAAMQDVFYDRLLRAFQWLEKQVNRGVIRYYGVSSNTLTAVSQDPSFVSLEKLFAIAESISTDHHFRVIQFPLNPYEQGAIQQHNQQNNTCSLLEFAQEHHIGTFVNRPLNAMTDEGLCRLASFRFGNPQQIVNDFKQRLAAVEDLEQSLHADILPQSQRETAIEKAAEFLHLSQHLKQSLHEYKDWFQWDQFRQQYLLTGLSAAFQELNDLLTRNDEWKQWSFTYIESVARLLDTIALYYESRQQLRSQSLMNHLEELSVNLELVPTLSQQTLCLTRSIPGVDCVLVGMRQNHYVDDALAALRHGVIPDACSILEELDTSR